MNEAMIDCPRCGQRKPADSRNTHICVDCSKAENARYSYLRTHQENWIEAAADAGIDLWLQQPGETQWEYTVWVAYRDSYPGKKPSYGDVAQQLGTTYNVVRKVAQRWTFPARMQAWIVECDRITLAQRRQEVLDMNKSYVDMSSRLRDKLSTAIDMLSPGALKPTEINALFKTASELERRARLDNIDQYELQRELFVDNENPELKKAPTKQNDLAEVVKILAGAGVLGNITQIGVREVTTTTREVVAKDSDGAVLTHEED